VNIGLVLKGPVAGPRHTVYSMHAAAGSQWNWIRDSGITHKILENCACSVFANCAIYPVIYYVAGT